MPKKLTFEYIKEFINKEQLLISTEYVNNKKLLDIQCNICKQNYEQNFDRYKNGHRHQKCTYNKIINLQGGIASARKRYGDTFLKETIRICELCKKDYIPKKTLQKLCDKDCAFDYTQTDSYKDICKINGSKGGMISAEKQQRRSKNEITFANLCIEYFGEDDILCNERIFKDKNNAIWDCDCYIKSLKIACLWNGIWHYKKVNKNHNLEQVQRRDKWKCEIILNNGSTFYTIKDMGKADENFVKEQFDLFIHKLHFKNVLSLINA